MHRFRTRVLRAAAIVIAVTTALVVFRDLQALHARAGELGARVPVLLATHDLPPGHVVTSHDVAVTTRYASQTSPSALGRAGAAVGATVRVGIIAGDVVTAGHVVRAGTAGLVTAGHVAVRIPDSTGVSPPPGSIVDVYATSAAATTASAQLVVEGAEVLDAPSPKATSDGADGTTGAPNSALTVLIHEQEAPRLAFAIANGTLFVAIAPLESECCRP